MRVDLISGSLEWFEHRAKHDNASEAAIVMDCAPKFWNKTKRGLWEEKNGILQPANGDNIITNFGHKLESFARDHIAKRLKLQLEPAVFVNGRYSASLDAYGTDAESRSVKIEIKCPFQKEHSETWKFAREGEVQEHYKWQLVHQDYCAPTELSYFFVYINDTKNVLIPWQSSDEDTQSLIAGWEDFHANEPEPDWVVIEDDHMRVLIDEHKELKRRKTTIETELKQVEEVIKNRASAKNVISFGCKIQTINKKGSVDYSRIPDLSSVNLDDYRKESSSYQKITHEK
tara:strand:+ start:21 stop:881 length:861 start_codon:yes stop_codon:yes gene_type:complete